MNSALSRPGPLNDQLDHALVGSAKREIGLETVSGEWERSGTTKKEAVDAFRHDPAEERHVVQD